MRAKVTIEQARQEGRLLAIARDYLSLAKVEVEKMMSSTSGDSFKALEYMDRAVDSLRHAGTRNELPRGLLARAGLFRMTHNFKRAHADLSEALELSTRCGMYLFQADCQLEATRLHLAEGDPDNARHSLLRGHEVVRRLAYWRRRSELMTLEQILGPATPPDRTGVP